MTAQADTPLAIDERLALLTKQSAALDARRIQSQQEVDSCAAQIEVLGQRFTAIQVSSTALAHLPPLDAEHKWLDHLNTWRKNLCDELLALSQQDLNRADMDRQQKLEYSVRLIDFGLGAAVHSPFIDLSSMPLGQLMAEAGYATKGAELCGPRGWLGSMPEVEDHIEDVTKRRAEAQAALDDALTTDEERATHEAETKVFPQGSAVIG